MGTKIDTAAVAKAGGNYSTVADNLGTVASRVRGFTAEASDFGRKYQSHGAAYASTMESLAKGVDAWQVGSRACGTGLTGSASAHVTTDDNGADTVNGA
ncbi:hypothetical protein AXK56_12040 [Tsukamurella pulmonis]|uniref:Excreted virulence factor EspC, type VII ESX diderm n=1 Tax=Tsukamurella pulmonis TaxID=47312 RepID=A0A1H1H2S3_9ACTN|nr:hypothetical protein [Tsukamurella pulmonis]KXO88101.1 hypothetical protein AXK56_12040 [Tsukamurella pulmonis]SDR19376.1 hypothetical protein SAMN04489765_3744 [Tsukamurella pulmonis]SUP16143.1 Uncharacterised protein [Tsukamurella pulmonis]